MTKATRTTEGRRERGELFKLFVLIRMQLKALVDLSFFRSKRNFILRAGIALILFAAATAAFYAVFYVCSLLSIFSFGGGIPDTLMTLLFTLIQFMSICSCTAGLAKTLYKGGDNVILLVLPVQQNTVFISKLAVYYIFELKRNFSLTVPLFLAYGLIGGAVWFYYPWMLFCFLFVSMLPVAIGALLSIPALYIPKLISRIRPVKYVLLVLGAGAIIALAFWLVSLIPENINILGQWGSISQGLRDFLNGFALYLSPWHYLDLMMVGGTLAISRNPVTTTSLISLAVLVAVLAALIAASFFTSRVLFLKLTARAGEGGTSHAKVRPNRVRRKGWSMISEELLRSARSGKALWKNFLEFFFPAFLLFALNRIYASMNTSLTGQTMTSAFNVLVLLVTVLSSNAYLAHIYSRDGAARNLLKTRPVDFRRLLASRLVLRIAVSTLSIATAVVLYGVVEHAGAGRAIAFLLMAVFVNAAHIFWCAELDVMNPESESSGANSAKATVIGVVLSALFAAGYYLISNSGQTYAFIVLACVAGAFCALRAFLYFERVRVYFLEK